MHPTRIFKEPEAMQIAWDEYLADLKKQSNEWLKIQYVGKDGNRKEDGVKVPKTLEGFKRFCYKKYGEIGQYFKNQDNIYNNFIPICSRIREEIREDQILGGLLGFYNPSITQRLNGLIEKVEQTNIEQPFFNDVPKNDSDKQNTSS